ncbi:MAG: RtcB family protein [Phycisphaerae bacterium]|nr:RtcB family protein [Phycisphaerae bacterium]
MKTRELMNLGLSKPATKVAVACCRDARMSAAAIRELIPDIAGNPGAYVDDDVWSPLAAELLRAVAARESFVPRQTPAPWRQWGENLEESSVAQLEAAAELPIAVRGALMPDAHMGYGLPIGGVLATDNAVIPYAVGMDIACRMRLSVFDLPADALDSQRAKLRNALSRETCFGVGASFRKQYRRSHKVMDADWSVSPITQRFKDKAWSQLGTSGSGNHFVEFGTLTLDRAELGLAAGVYLALLSHSGSRGTGSEVARHYSHLAMDKHPELPKHLRQLAWLGLDTAAGQEYWAAMELMGEYAAANHELIHRYITRNLGVKVIAEVENHHNFAWRETHDGREVIVHRKGATPAHEGVLGVVPGSMATPGFVVRGKGNEESLCSASHGAGRVMSRTQAKKTLTWSDAKKRLAAAGVEVMQAGLDEVPMVYKDIFAVMDAQADLVETIARFDPKLVRMAPGGERPED